MIDPEEKNRVREGLLLELEGMSLEELKRMYVEERLEHGEDNSYLWERLVEQHCAEEKIGWYVKVDVPVIFNIDMNIGVVAEDQQEAERKAETAVLKWLESNNYQDALEEQLPWDFTICGDMWHRGGESSGIDFQSITSLATPDPDFDPKEINNVFD